MLNRSNLHNYQEKAVQHIMENPFCALFMEMGLGKTISILTAVEQLMYYEFEIDKALVVAPKRVAEVVWTDEIEEWQHVSHLKVSRIIGTEKQRICAIKEKADIYMISRDNIAWLCSQFGGSMLPYDMLVIDESSSFKNHDSNRFKALKYVRASLDRIVLATGTPRPQGLQDLWSQLYILDGGERLGTHITHYRNRFLVKSYNGWTYEPRPFAEDVVNKLIGDICISMKAEDYLELPGRKNNYLKIVFNAKLQKQYSEFRKEKVLELIEEMREEGNAEITADNAAALTTKLLQFANGAVYDKERNVHEMHALKLDALEEIIDEANGAPILVATTYQHDRDRIEKRFKKLKPRRMEGKKTIRDWNAGKIRLLVMHPASGGHGLNIQKGGHIIVWFGQTWSLELYQQFNARLDRQGQKFLVMIHHIVVKGTMDEHVLKALDSKDQGQQRLMKEVKALIDKQKAA